jgi:hypothetical protein
MTQINLDYARKNEGWYYGHGAADLAEAVAKAAAKYKTAQKQAKAVYEVLRKAAAADGMKPDIECYLRPDTGGYRVSFEAGPYEWAIVASEALSQCGIFAEPYYSFDLCFYTDGGL